MKSVEMIEVSYKNLGLGDMICVDLKSPRGNLDLEDSKMFRDYIDRNPYGLYIGSIGYPPASQKGTYVNYILSNDCEDDSVISKELKLNFKKYMRKFLTEHNVVCYGL